MICEHCKKDKIVTFTIEAAPEVKDATLRAQLAAEGRGAVKGELVLCNKCYLDGFPEKKVGVAA